MGWLFTSVVRYIQYIEGEKPEAHGLALPSVACAQPFSVVGDTFFSRGGLLIVVELEDRRPVSNVDGF